MFYSTQYTSAMGNLTLVSTDQSLVGLWVEDQKYFAATIGNQVVHHSEPPILLQTKAWLDRYFAGEQPVPTELSLAPVGSAFRQAVWKILLAIPYGQVTTYGAIAQIMAQKLGRTTMSSQAVGGAVGHNPISIIIPCHRVVGAQGNLTGYAGGLDKKIYLLELEGIDISKFFIPKKGTAL
ncbi:MAG: methylated-DNA--[protein]-cysteine S-methyltransferase [Desulfomicrobium sp.]|nr:methylated-DNA--[protein]-cysteine S-methyltransferase [Desulfomicrobium sp.]